MRRLQNQHRLQPLLPLGCFLNFCRQRLKCAEVLLRQHELAGVGPGLRRHRNRLKPKQPCSTARKTAVPPRRQFAGRAIRRTVAALHRLNCQAVGKPAPRHLKGHPQNVYILGEGKPHSAFFRPLHNRVQALICKFFCPHFYSTSCAFRFLYYNNNRAR